MTPQRRRPLRRISAGRSAAGAACPTHARTLIIVAVVVLLLVCLVPVPQRVVIDGQARRVDGDGSDTASYAVAVDAWRWRYLLRDDRMAMTVTVAPDAESAHDADAAQGDAGADDTGTYRLEGVTVRDLSVGDSPRATLIAGMAYDATANAYIPVEAVLLDGTILIVLGGHGAYAAPAANRDDADRLIDAIERIIDVTPWLDASS